MLSPQLRDALSAQLAAYAARRAVLQAGGNLEGSGFSPQGSSTSTAGLGRGAQPQVGACRFLLVNGSS